VFASFNQIRVTARLSLSLIFATVLIFTARWRYVGTALTKYTHYTHDSHHDFVDVKNNVEVMKRQMFTNKKRK